MTACLNRPDHRPGPVEIAALRTALHRDLDGRPLRIATATTPGAHRYGHHLIEHILRLDLRVQCRLVPVRGQIAPALAQGDVDIAVRHHADYLGATPPQALHAAGVLPRLDPQYALVTRGHRPLHELPRGSVIATTSDTAAHHLTASIPGADYEFRPVSGPIGELLDAIALGHYRALVAPVSQLGNWPHRITALFPLTTTNPTSQARHELPMILPAPGTGTLLLHTTGTRPVLTQLAHLLTCPRTALTAHTEHALATNLTTTAGAQPGLCAHATLDDHGTLHLSAAVLTRHDRTPALLHAQATGHDPDRLGRRVAADLLARNAH
ncbi:hypothetical protein GCM10010174_03790 [Kutzneria viridogrisea]|uniref:hydroxymethylbilane synthase n=1 Tax=Kutzneria viridogrisea TaxID=47990 RepID=A0ABR6BRD0_9PSEU|nr:hydroxymethylbilane synthase [Kutzneria viridogrisea]